MSASIRCRRPRRCRLLRNPYSRCASTRCDSRCHRIRLMLMTVSPARCRAGAVACSRGSNQNRYGSNDENEHDHADSDHCCDPGEGEVPDRRGFRFGQPRRLGGIWWSTPRCDSTSWFQIGCIGWVRFRGCGSHGTSLHSMVGFSFGRSSLMGACT